MICLEPICLFHQLCHKLPDHLRSDTIEKKKSTFLDRGHYMLSNGELSKYYSPLEVVKGHASEQSVQQH